MADLALQIARLVVFPGIEGVVVLHLCRGTQGWPRIAALSCALLASVDFVHAGEFAGFADPVLYPVELTPRSIRACDIDDDNDVDLITANSGSGSISILLNRGDGVFDAAINIPVANSMRDVAVADLNNDGIRDLVGVSASSPLGEPFDTIGRVAILYGLGGGQFEEPQFLFAGIQPVGVAAGDLNNDGRVDVVVTNQLSGDFSVFLNSDKGIRQDPVTYRVPLAQGSIPGRVALADMDRDSDLDAVLVNAHNGPVATFYNDGNGGFAHNESVPSPLTTGRTMSMGDIDRDGFPDLAVAKFGLAGIDVYRNKGGHFSLPTLYSTSLGVLQEGLAPLRGGSTIDLIGTGNIPIGPNSNGPLFMAIFVGDNSGEFSRTPVFITFDLMIRPEAQVEADFNGDGVVDVAVGLESFVGVFLNLTSAESPFDLTNDGVVNGADLGELLRAWGQAGPSDFDSSGTTDGRDLAGLLANWTTVTPK